MLDFLRSHRYFFRELLPRFIVMTLVIRYLMPFVPGLSFHDSLPFASLVGLFFTAYFVLWGAYIMAATPVQDFLNGIKGGAALFVVHVGSLVLIPLPGLALAVLLGGHSFHATAWYGFALWIVVLNACCALTHDYGASPAPDAQSHGKNTRYEADCAIHDD